MRIRFLAAAAVAAMILNAVAPGPASGASNKPNSKANPLCGFGPGVARWSVKTSIPNDQDPNQLATVAADDLVNAPDLQVDQQTVASAHSRVTQLRAAMQAHAAAPQMALSAAPAQPFVAHLRWGPRRIRAHGAAAMSARPGNAAPSRDF